MYGFSWIAWMVFSSLKFFTCFTIPPINQTSSLCYVTISPVSDFLIDGKYTFEVGGKKKRQRQLQSIENGYVVKDDIETGYGNIIPLWMFGMLY